MLRALVVAAIGLVMVPLAAAATRLPLTAPQYRARASSICRVAKRRLDAVPDRAWGASTNNLSLLVPYLHAAIRIEGAEMGKLGTLKPPLALAPLVTRGLASKRNQIVVFSKLLTEDTAGNLTFAEALAALSKVPDGSAIWPKVGVPICEY